MGTKVDYSSKDKYHDFLAKAMGFFAELDKLDTLSVEICIYI